MRQGLRGGTAQGNGENACNEAKWAHGRVGGRIHRRNDALFKSVGARETAPFVGAAAAAMQTFAIASSAVPTRFAE
jgi:hypothetical protein